MIRREPFRSVLEKVAIRMGIDPEENLQANQAAAIASYMDSRVGEAWERQDWPWSRVLEERVFADRWDELDAEDITAEMVVFHLGSYWRALDDAPEDEPAAGSGQWEETVPTRRGISLTQARQTIIGECLDVWTENPETSPDARKLRFVIDAAGIFLPADRQAVPNEVWVNFSVRPPRFTSKQWSAALVYQAGALVYYPEAGDCFVCLATHSNVAPPVELTASTYWVRQELPQELALHVELAAWADVLDEDGETDKAAAKELKAEEALADAIDRLAHKQHQIRRFRVITR